MQFAAIAASNSGNNTIVAAQSGDRKIIVVHQLFLVAAADVTAKFQSGASGTDLTGAMPIGINGGMVLPYNREGWFETTISAGAANLLNLNLGSAVAVGGAMGYSVR